MKKNKVIFVWVFIGLLLFVSIIFVQINQRNSEENRKNEDVLNRALRNQPLSELAVSPQDYIQGNFDSAKVIVVEYSNTECPYCKSFHNKFKDQVFNLHSEEVAWVYRHFPLPIFSKSPKEAEALECAAEQGGNNAFWEYLEAIFAVTPSNDGLDLSLLPKVAKDLKLNVKTFTQCLDSGQFAEKISGQKLEGAKMGVRLTPSVLIWNKTTDERVLISGANSRFAEVKVQIEKILQSQ